LKYQLNIGITKIFTDLNMFGKSKKEKENLRMELPEGIKKKLDGFLRDSEKIIYSYKGAWGTHRKGSKTSIVSSAQGWDRKAGTQWGSPWLVVTNERILIIGKGLFSIDIREIPIENIKSIDYEQGITMDTLTFHAHSSIEGIQFWDNDRKWTNKFPKLIKELMKNKLNHSKENQEEPLKILKLRYAKGEITKKEFEQMKKDLAG